MSHPRHHPRRSSTCYTSTGIHIRSASFGVRLLSLIPGRAPDNPSTNISILHGSSIGLGATQLAADSCGGNGSLSILDVPPTRLPRALLATAGAKWRHTFTKLLYYYTTIPYCYLVQYVVPPAGAKWRRTPMRIPPRGPPWPSGRRGPPLCTPKRGPGTLDASRGASKPAPGHPQTDDFRAFNPTNFAPSTRRVPGVIRRGCRRGSPLRRDWGRG